ncbi:MAG: diguanylate cyclase, partial [Acidaminobacteraceae bacterium]
FEGNFCIVSNITQEYVYEKELNFLANKDPLTGLNNRRHFKRLATEILQNQNDEYLAVMMDIDKFKNINDTYGHDVGDIAIRSVADIIETTVGDHGVVGRYGGEEFIILLHMDVGAAYNLLEDIRINIEKNTINYGAGSVKLTISGGCSTLHNATDDSMDQSVIFADQALLEAKKTGRNKIIVYNDELHGSKAIDKLTGTFTKSALMYKHNQFHDNLRKSDITYGMIIINLNTLIVNQFEILNQYVKQTASTLNGLLRDNDIVGRYDDMTFIILINNVNKEVVENIRERIIVNSNKLSAKFDNLVEAEVADITISDCSIKTENIYSSLFEELRKSKKD